MFGSPVGKGVCWHRRASRKHLSWYVHLSLPFLRDDFFHLYTWCVCFSLRGMAIVRWTIIPIRIEIRLRMDIKAEMYLLEYCVEGSVTRLY